MKLNIDVNPKELVKTTTGVVVGIGVHLIVGGIISNNVPKGNIAQNACVFAAKSVLSGVISETAKKHTDEQIDQLVDNYNEIMKSSDTEDDNGRTATE